MRTTLAREATRSAQRVVVVVLVCALVVMSVFVAERLSFQGRYEQAADRLRLATSLGGDILRHADRLSLTTRLAIATREDVWRGEFDTTRPRLREAMRMAREIAPPGLRKSLDDETIYASDRLSQMQDRVFEHIARGETAIARTIVDSGVYQQNKAILNKGTARFIEQLRNHYDTERAAIARLSLFLLGLVGLCCVLGGLVLWRYLRRALTRSEEAYEAAEAEIRSLALNDSLTGLANRRHFHAELSRAVARTDGAARHVGVLVIDIDRFKAINDLHGLPTGDMALRLLGERLLTCSRPGELVARTGADEFVALCPLTDDDEAPIAAAQRYLDAIREPLRLDGLTLDLTAGIGIARWPHDAATPEELMRKADIALVRAKAEGRGEIRLFDVSFDDQLQQRGRIEEELSAAILAGHIVPYYQPIIDLASGRTHKLEVLARWRHPERGLISPATFIPVAEETGLVTELTYAILRRACLDARDWPGGVTIAVNVSAQTLLDPWFVERVLAVLEQTHFPANRLEIEITESVLVHDIQAARRVIGVLKSHAVRLSLDDFGVGYSSLSYLSELAFDTLKIDQSFVRLMHDSAPSTKIITAIIGLGRSLGLPVIAEGIETERDAQVLRALGCELGQGYWFARPEPAEAMTARLASKPRAVAARAA